MSAETLTGACLCGAIRCRGKTREEIARAEPLFVLYVADQAAAAGFYRAVLAAEPRLDVPGMTEFALPGGATLGLMPAAGIERLLPGLRTGSGPRAELYLRVEDPQGMHARALAAGAEELSPLEARDWGETVAYSLDPEGHVLALAARK